MDLGVGLLDAAPISQGIGGWLLATVQTAAKRAPAGRQSRTTFSIVSTGRNDAAKHAPSTRLSEELTIEEEGNGEQRLSQLICGHHSSRPSAKIINDHMYQPPS